MTQWTPELEARIHAVGKAMDKQMKDFVNPKSSVLGSGLRTAFISATRVQPRLKKAYKAAGLEPRGWETGSQKLIDIAEQNGSDAADKIKQWLPVSKDIADQIDNGIGKQIKYAKQKYGH